MRIPSVFDLRNIQQSFRDVWEALKPLETGPIDLGGRRITNAGKSIAPADYITQRELTTLQRTLERDLPSSVSVVNTSLFATGKLVMVGVFASRPTAFSVPGQVFAASDRNYVSWFSDGAAWLYLCGICVATLANITTGLTTNDAGYLFYASDYKHLWRWGGSSWDFGPGDPGSQFIVAGTDIPSGGLWAACGGGVVVCSTAAGGVTNITTPNLSGDVFIRGGNLAAVAAAARAQWETTARTETENAHTHSVDPAPTTSGTPSATTSVGGTGTDVASSTHTHSTDIAGTTSAAGSAHSHVLNDTNAQLKIFSDANGGLPLRISIPWYIRR
jgi:hypothetical protein